MATTDDLKDTSGHLIAGDKVAGTNVYNNAGEKLGSIEDVMIDKRTGRIAYAVLSFGGFLGMGDEHYPLPWSTMTYDPELGGYRVALDKRVLEGAPAYARDDEMAWEDEAWGRRIHDYYHVDPYWSVGP
jgi:hypothetical protein